MKINIFILLVGLLSNQLAVFAQSDTTKIKVQIQSDTTIVVRDLFENCKLYGDKSQNERYGGDDDWFKKNMRKINREEKSRYYSYDKDNGVCIKLKYSDINEDSLKINFYRAVLKEIKGWCPNEDSIYTVILVKRSQEYSKEIHIQSDTTIVVRHLFDNCELYGDKFGNERYGGSNGGFEKIMKEINSENNHYCSYDEKNGVCIKLKYDDIKSDSLIIKFYGAKHLDNGWYPDKYLNYSVKIVKMPHHKNNLDLLGIFCIALPVFIFVIICLIIIIVVRINVLSKKVNNLSVNKTQLLQKTEDINIDNIRQVVISGIQSQDLIQLISNDDIHDVINRPDIQLYIKNVITCKVDDYLRDKVNIPTSSNLDVLLQPDKAVHSELVKTKVEYFADKNCFIITDNPVYEIFEIYSRNGEFYYTIIDDLTLRRNLLSVISAYTKCIEYRLDSPMPSIVEIIRDGRLIKSGDIYIVDTNCKLQVSFK